MAYTAYETIEEDKELAPIYNYLYKKGYYRTLKTLLEEHKTITTSIKGETKESHQLLTQKTNNSRIYEKEKEPEENENNHESIERVKFRNTIAKENGTRWSLATQLVAGYEFKDVYGSSSIPIYQTSTFEQPSASESGAYDYTRSGNPTRQILEKQIACLEYGTHAFAFSTGMAAISSVAHLAKSGDEIIVCDDCYGGTYRLVSRILCKYGVKVEYADLSGYNGPKNLLSMISSKTKVIMIESPTNPLQKICDIRALAEIAHEYSAYLSVDNTMLSPVLQNPLTLGADIVIHSGTKFLNGQADTMSGIVVVKDNSLAEEIYFYQNAEGTALSPFDCWLTARGLKTMELRVQRAEENARIIASFLNNHALVTKVFYTGLCDSTNEASHIIHTSQARGYGSVISFRTENVALSEHIAESTKLFKITVSFGSVNSLISLPARMSHASIPENVRKARSFPEDLLRISVGIEDVDDLIRDLNEAFNSYMAIQLKDCSI